MLETIRAGASAPGARVALFDFDGTLSLIRSGWLEIMLDMIVEGLVGLNAGESAEQLRAHALELVWPHTGKDTLFQMEAFAEAIRDRGGKAMDPLVYKQKFLEALYDISERRIADLQEGRCPPDRYLVPGARALLEELRGRGLKLYLASGTDHDRLQHEAALLDIARYFDGGIFGALPDPDAFSKGMLVTAITSEPGMHGSLLVGFGDGPTEIIEIHRAGGVAIGVATDEPECRATSPFKRQSLIENGADYIIPNYLCRHALVPVLFAKHEPI
jgi:phosphoglycolate phosphatase-like HAD superfamily hydrolase